MAVTSASSAGLSAAQYAWQQVQLQQAQRNADQAQANARTLRQQADAAQRTADREQDSARSLAVEADQAQQAAGQADRGLQFLRATGVLASQLNTQAATVVQAVTGGSKVQASPVVNSQGQVTGKVVNTSA
ncbi:MAG TPA: hypothetical protein VMB75_12040 [Rhodocyclaceae bacterium]|nr:hypothetical protein [Rhodocyclaceae bacterium]